MTLHPAHGAVISRYGQRYECLHSVGSVCWLCSDQVPWWREARIKAGFPDVPAWMMRGAAARKSA